MAEQDREQSGLWSIKLYLAANRLVELLGADHSLIEVQEVVSQINEAWDGIKCREVILVLENLDKKPRFS